MQSALDAITNSTFAEHLQPPLEALKCLPQIALNDRELAELRHGRPIERRNFKPRTAGNDAAAEPNAEWAAVDPAGHLAAILFEKQPNQLWPARNFEA